MALIVKNCSEIDAQVEIVKESARQAVAKLQELCGLAPMEFFWHVKFDAVGFHPIEPRRINVIEQINQMWTYLAALEASRILLRNHPTSGAMLLAPGAHASQPLDIMSEDEKVGAEVFATVDPANNKKLKLDRAKLIGKVRDDLKLYIFFMSPRRHPTTTKLADKHQRDGVEVWSLEKPSWLVGTAAALGLDQ
jgi:hypothetical protein